MKNLSPSLLLAGALVFSGCSNLQTEYEKQRQLVREQKVLIAELTETNAYLKERNLSLEAQLKKANLNSDYSQRVNSLSSTYERKLQQMISSLDQQLESSISNIPDVSVSKTSEGTVITMSNSILFSPGSAKLSASGKKVLSQVVKVLKEYPNNKIRVDGHSDSDPIRRSKSKYSSNWDLSATRAVRVVEGLTIAKGIPGEQISVGAHSMYRPVDPSNKKLNRRVEIVVLN
jgi:chemotaxis protein MotB